jgi:hypothetical protein
MEHQLKLAVQFFYFFKVSNATSSHAIARIRPQRIAARRQRELMCVLIRDESATEEFEWHEEQYVDTTALNIPQMDNRVEYGTPVYTIGDRAPVWKTVED